MGPPLAAVTNAPFGVTASAIPLPSGNGPAGTGDPTRVKAPVVVSMVNALTSFELVFPAKRQLPTIPALVRLAAKKPPPLPVPPVRNGDPGTRVSAPLVPTEKPETVLGAKPMSSLVYTNFCAEANPVNSSVNAASSVDE